MKAETQTPAAHIGELTAELMQDLASLAPAEEPIAGLAAVWTERGIYWRVDTADEGDGETTALATARLAACLAEAALHEDARDAEADHA